jgi:hypothetical protein
MRAIVLLYLLLSACASHEVRCDRRLRPINAPAARGAAVGAGAVEDAGAGVHR